MQKNQANRSKQQPKNRSTQVGYAIASSITCIPKSETISAQWNATNIDDYKKCLTPTNLVHGVRSQVVRSSVPVHSSCSQTAFLNYSSHPLCYAVHAPGLLVSPPMFCCTPVQLEACC